MAQLSTLRRFNGLSMPVQVRIGDGQYVSGMIPLRDGVTLHVAEGATLIGSDNPEDYQSIDPFVDATGQNRGTCLIGALA